MFVIPPFRFNAWKHHLYWVKERLNVIRDNPDNMGLRDDAVEKIKSINSNHLDIYKGKLEPQQIIQAIEGELKIFSITNRNEFVSWLKQKEFQFTTIQDRSIWVLREGVENDLFIHIHPARNSPNVVRIHGNTWKTVMILKMFYANIEDISLNKINAIRVQNLKLSPIKNLENSQRLLNTIKFLGE